MNQHAVERYKTAFLVYFCRPVEVTAEGALYRVKSTPRSEGYLFTERDLVESAERLEARAR